MRPIIWYNPSKNPVQVAINSIIKVFGRLFGVVLVACLFCVCWPDILYKLFFFPLKHHIPIVN